MNEAAEIVTPAAVGDQPSQPMAEPSKWRNFLLTLPQPVLVLGSMLTVASAYSYEWVDPDLFAAIMTVLPLPLILLAERLWTKRKDWILTPKEFAEDAFWLAGSNLIWVPLYLDYYRTPISDGFHALRDATPLNITLEPQSTLGLIVTAIFIRTLSEFVYYWLHRAQHLSLFWWRMHATHHHITKMSAARSDRTHPLEFMALMVGTPIVLALTGASDEVVAVTGAFSFFSAYLNHANLPLRSGIYGWFFTTTEQHHLHHSIELESSNSNFGCTIIIWDRIFGTYSGRTDVKAMGAGSGKALTIWDQYRMAFVSKDKLTKF
ncbi:sterol desaturase family protein [Halioxenophilus sp. WMMB6]|uniref:sterol desaturase family protein n=1 Tax=Halioxenophilus sp. WMMB6 TaxID=3073815 RepID=UPI00295F4096|nr:sterol desaturase family protein [Halioxenophilus sp. WMMB6]